MTELTDKQQEELEELLPMGWTDGDFEIAVIKLLIQIRDKK